MRPTPAFPTHGYAEGMSLLDYFAAQAMTAFIAACDGDVQFDLVAFDAYSMADAMLAERKAERKAERTKKE